MQASKSHEGAADFDRFECLTCHTVIQERPAQNPAQPPEQPQKSETRGPGDALSGRKDPD
jgi:hypothetical protein